MREPMEVNKDYQISDEDLTQAEEMAGKKAEITAEMVMEHAKKIASYKRPQHVELWPSGKDFPITRSTKVDKLALKEAAKSVIDDLRRQGRWDAS